MKEKRAILLRGFHYDENHKTNSSFYRRWGSYNLDYERKFKSSFEKIKNDERFESDFYIVTNQSKKLDGLINYYKPKKYLVEDLYNSHQFKTTLTGLKMIQEYASENNIIYHNVIQIRMDLVYNRNPMDYIDYLNVPKDKVSVFLKSFCQLNVNFCDLFFYIPFECLQKFIKAIDDTKILTQAEYMKKYCILSEISPSVLPELAKDIYNYIRLDSNENDMTEADREHACSWDTTDKKFLGCKWKK